MTTFSVSIRPDCLSQFVQWQRKLSEGIAGASGFVSLEFLCTSQSTHRWVIVQRFYSKNSLEDWRNSSEYRALVKELANIASNEGVIEKCESELNLKSGVTEVIITNVPLEKEGEFRQWSAKIHSIEAQFEGFRGIYVQSPTQTRNRNWITLLQFDTPEHLDKWMDSSERKEILKESASLIQSFETHRVASPYAGWFRSLAKNESLPPVWKQTMLVLLVLFPIVMLQMKYLSPWTQALNPSLGSFLSCTMSVTLITFPMMPLAVKFLGWWLLPADISTWRITILGTLCVLFLYIIEVLVFWHFI